MDYRDKIISDIAEQECKRISRKVILRLQKMTEGMQSGDDSPLRNIWDQVCVQVQGEESVFWNLYVEMIFDDALYHVQQLDASTKEAMWLQTNDGTDWAEDEDRKEDRPGYCEEEIASHITHRYVLHEAANWTNARIRKDQERPYDEQSPPPYWVPSTEGLRHPDDIREDAILQGLRDAREEMERASQGADEDTNCSS